MTALRVLVADGDAGIYDAIGGALTTGEAPHKWCQNPTLMIYLTPLLALIPSHSGPTVPKPRP